MQHVPTTDPIIIIGGSLSFVAGMAWNDAFQTLFSTYLGKGGAIWAKFIYAALLTVVVIIMILAIMKIRDYLSKVASENEPKILARAYQVPNLG